MLTTVEEPPLPYDRSTTILTWESSSAVQGSVRPNDLLGVEQVAGGKTSIRIFPRMKFQEHGTVRQQTAESLSATFALPELIALNIKPWLLNNAVRKTSNWGTERSESEMTQRPTNAKKETPITVFRSMGLQSRTARRRHSRVLAHGQKNCLKPVHLWIRTIDRGSIRYVFVRGFPRKS